MSKDPAPFPDKIPIAETVEGFTVNLLRDTAHQPPQYFAIEVQFDKLARRNSMGSKDPEIGVQAAQQTSFTFLLNVMKLLKSSYKARKPPEPILTNSTEILGEKFSQATATASKLSQCTAIKFFPEGMDLSDNRIFLDLANDVREVISAHIEAREPAAKERPARRKIASRPFSNRNSVVKDFVSKSNDLDPGVKYLGEIVKGVELTLCADDRTPGDYRLEANYTGLSRQIDHAETSTQEILAETLELLRECGHTITAKDNSPKTHPDKPGYLSTDYFFVPDIEKPDPLADKEKELYTAKIAAVNFSSPSPMEKLSTNLLAFIKSMDTQEPSEPASSRPKARKHTERITPASCLQNQPRHCAPRKPHGK